MVHIFEQVKRNLELKPPRSRSSQAERGPHEQAKPGADTEVEIYYSGSRTQNESSNSSAQCSSTICCRNIIMQSMLPHGKQCHWNINIASLRNQTHDVLKKNVKGALKRQYTYLQNIPQGLQISSKYTVSSKLIKHYFLKYLFWNHSVLC